MNRLLQTADAWSGTHTADPAGLRPWWACLCCGPRGSGGAVHGSVEPSFLPVSPLLRWLAADLMGLAAVEEKQWWLVAHALVRTKSSEHATELQRPEPNAALPLNYFTACVCSVYLIDFLLKPCSGCCVLLLVFFIIFHQFKKTISKNTAL